MEIKRKKIRVLVMDVDGTLTDGKIYVSDSGECMKAFSVKDGYGIRELLPQNNIIPVIVTGRYSEIVKKRAQELEIIYVFQNVKNKMECLEKIIDSVNEKTGKDYDLGNVAYIGDDINDLVCIRRVKETGGLTGCPSNAVEKIKKECHFVSIYQGGDGAAREFIEWLIELKGEK